MEPSISLSNVICFQLYLQITEAPFLCGSPSLSVQWTNGEDETLKAKRLKGKANKPKPSRSACKCASQTRHAGFRYLQVISPHLRICLLKHPWKFKKGFPGPWRGNPMPQPAEEFCYSENLAETVPKVGPSSQVFPILSDATRQCPLTPSSLNCTSSTPLQPH